MSLVKDGDIIFTDKLPEGFIDPGDMTIDELKKQLSNPDDLPFWMMHPLVQHCLRACWEGINNAFLETKDHDMIDYGVKRVRPEAMFLEKYRFKKEFLEDEECFQDYIDHGTSFGNWKFRFDNCPLNQKI
jgi:hypothetical protein